MIHKSTFCKYLKLENARFILVCFCSVYVLVIFLFVQNYFFLNFSQASFLRKHRKYDTRLLSQIHPAPVQPRNESNRDLNVFPEAVYGLTANKSHRSQMISATEFWEGKRTGNSLIDDYGKNNLSIAGELGRGVILTPDKKAKGELALQEFHINTVISDEIPLNRRVPDSRIRGCAQLQYNQSLPSASVIIPFHNEWLSILLRTVYSVINRSPRHLLKEIILIDDASTLGILKDKLEDYIENHFPQGLIRLVRLPKRTGLIRVRTLGATVATGDVLVFFDSHMEVNVDWLPPLLYEIAQDRKIAAMSTLDYILPDTFRYKYHNSTPRYVWDWRLLFFEKAFRPEQIRPLLTSPRPGPTLVGAAFAIDRQYFFELGGFDTEMSIWGGENLEMSWRVWLCGGRLLHIPCSRIGHIPRSQPYSFEGNREHTVHFNYKRAVSTWMGNYSRFVYQEYPDMKKLDVGDISRRIALKNALRCKDFGWYLRNVWPELNVPDENVIVWGQVVNEASGMCMDNKYALYKRATKMNLQECTDSISKQAFSLTTDHILRTTLHYVVAHDAKPGSEVKIEGFVIGSGDKWNYLQDQSMVHLGSGLCLDVSSTLLVLNKCQASSKSQKWLFRPFTFTN